MTSPVSSRYEEVVLASTSAARKTLLSALGVPFRVVAPEVDEHLLPHMTARQGASVLAERKARAVAKRFPLALVIGADQIASVDGVLLNKPADEAEAISQLSRLSGKTHELCTGLCVMGPGYFVCELDVVRLTMFALSEDQLRRYVALGEWKGCAGSYRIEGRGQALFSAVDGDRSSIMGLPMARLIRSFKEAELPLF